MTACGVYTRPKTIKNPHLFPSVCFSPPCWKSRLKPLIASYICPSERLSVSGEPRRNGNTYFVVDEGREEVANKWGLPQVIVWTNSHEDLCRELHAGPQWNNGLIKARLSTQGSSRVLGSRLDDGISSEGDVFFLLIKLRSRQLTQSGFGSSLINCSTYFSGRFYVHGMQHIHVWFLSTIISSLCAFIKLHIQIAKLSK